MRVRLLLVVAFTATLAWYARAHARVKCSSHDDVRAILRRRLRRNQSLIPAFVRTAFHDCIAASDKQPASGCNGSIRLHAERYNALNEAVRPVLQLLDGVLRARKCVSYADAIMIGTEEALVLAQGPDLRERLVRYRADVHEVDTEPLPDIGMGLSEMRRFFARRKLSKRTMVASVVGGHSLGHFLRSGRLEPFTPSLHVFDNQFAVNLQQKVNNRVNLDGFNTLPSDDVLLTDKRIVSLIQLYAGVNGKDGGVDRGIGLRLLRTDFARFMIRLSRLRGRRLTD